jgi:hypothetical protein
MRRREDKRSIATRILQAVAKVLIVTALGMGLGALLGDIGIPARMLGAIGALAITGTAVVVNNYACEAEKRRCEEERRAVELEDRNVDQLVAEMAAPSLDVAHDQGPEWESRFVRLLDEQRKQQMSEERCV